MNEIEQFHQLAEFSSRLKKSVEMSADSIICLDKEIIELGAERDRLRAVINYAILQFKALDENRVVGAQIISRSAIKRLQAALEGKDQ